MVRTSSPPVDETTNQLRSLPSQQVRTCRCKPPPRLSAPIVAGACTAAREMYGVQGSARSVPARALGTRAVSAAARALHFPPPHARPYPPCARRDGRWAPLVWSSHSSGRGNFAVPLGVTAVAARAASPPRAVGLPSSRLSAVRTSCRVVLAPPGDSAPRRRLGDLPPAAACSSVGSLPPLCGLREPTAL